MSQQNNRREFLKTTAAVGMGYWVAGTALADDKPKSANDQINFACIGVGGKGGSDSDDASKYGNIVAICDVDDNTLNKRGASEKFKDAKRYSDFRKMLDEVGKSIDAVTVSTPDHCHAAASAMAMRMGKACFTQKPLTHTLYEARVLAQIAREKKVATQMGNQGTASESLRRTAALIKAGAVGTVKEVHVWTNRPVWDQGIDRPAEKPVPPNLHWDEWLGPAPYRPYANGYHTFSWRGWWDFGTGALGDMACHTLNMPFMALDLRDPISVEAESSGHNKDSYPKWSVIKYEFPAMGSRPALSFVWYDGGKKISQEMIGDTKLDNSGCLVIGDKGKLYAPGDYCEKKITLLDGATAPEVDFVRAPDGGHFAEWVRAIRGGEPAMSNFPNYAGPLTETVLLGNLAVWAGKKVMWDAKNLKATNAPEVEPIIKSTYREGYTL